ncbi:hypothetical protein HPB48_010012 [Haemaphysalis longicornis]|uniref:Cytochrome P450 n=1 Tax=Haemaphysalis longicornis TaxID=44386 RepID=A0A9J6GC57_HAELO|nr:hypothetical protein HPB48_010012 [Haemaphysalis longicornis]
MWTGRIYSSGQAPSSFYFGKTGDEVSLQESCHLARRGFRSFGHLLYQKNVYNYRRCIELAKQYGPVLGFTVGTKYVVVLNNFKSIKEVLSRDELLYRPENSITGQPEFKGITFLNGDDWSVNRKFCLRMLRGLGIGKKLMEENIERIVRSLLQDELEELGKKIAALDGLPVNMDPYLKRSVSNNMAALVFGKRVNVEDHRHQLWFEKLQQLNKVFTPGARLFSLPSYAVKIAELLPWTSSRKIKEAYREIELFIK